jgi:hypothetical protein
MRRAMRNLLVVCSAVLCVSAVTMWARSMKTWDSADYYRDGRQPATPYDELYGVFSQRGSIGFGYIRVSAITPTEGCWGMHLTSTPASGSVGWPRQFRFLGLSHWNYRSPPSPQWRWMHAIGFDLPYWVIATVFAILPAIAIRRAWLARRVRRRLANGLCIACGYDVRASSERCPECGAALVPSPDTLAAGATQ